MYAISVTFEIEPARMDAFLALMQSNAKSSLAHEEGCLIFDVCRAQGSENTVFLYEKYTSEAAFQAHLKTEHFLALDAEITDMVVSKLITVFDVLD